MIFQFNVDAPPSANKIWRNSAGGVHRSKEYKNWLSMAAWQIATQVAAPVDASTDRIMLTFVHHPADGRHERRDLDNNIKPLCDLLEYSMLIANDRQIYSIRADRGSRMQSHHLAVTVQTYFEVPEPHDDQSIET